MIGWIVCCYENESKPNNAVIAVWNNGTVRETTDINQAAFLSDEANPIEEVRSIKGTVQKTYAHYDVRAIRVERTLTAI